MTFEELLQLFSEHGFDGMAEAIEIVLYEAKPAGPAMPSELIQSRNHVQATAPGAWEAAMLAVSCKSKCHRLHRRRG